MSDAVASTRVACLDSCSAREGPAWGSSAFRARGAGEKAARDLQLGGLCLAGAQDAAGLIRRDLMELIAIDGHRAVSGTPSGSSSGARARGASTAARTAAVRNAKAIQRNMRRAPIVVARRLEPVSCAIGLGRERGKAGRPHWQQVSRPARRHRTSRRKRQRHRLLQTAAGRNSAIGEDGYECLASACQDGRGRKSAPNAGPHP